MEPSNAQLSFRQEIVLGPWSEQEQDNIFQAHSKSKEIQHAMDTAVAHLVYLPCFSETFAPFASRIKGLLPIELKNQAEAENGQIPDDCELGWIARDLTPWLAKEGTVEISVEFAARIRNAVIGLEVELLKEDKLDKATCQVATKFLLSLSSFMQKNIAQISDSAIFDALFKQQSDDNKKYIEEMIIENNKILDIFRQKQLLLYQKELSSYKKMLDIYEFCFSPCERIVELAMRSLLKPQYLNIPGNNPLGIGLILSDKMVKDAQCAGLKCAMLDPEWIQSNIRLLEKCIDSRNRYALAQNEKEKFQVALDAINNRNGVAMNCMTSSMRLDVLCRIAKNSQEVPLYFKGVVMELCKEINDFKKEEREEELAEDLQPCSIS